MKHLLSQGLFIHSLLPPSIRPAQIRLQGTKLAQQLQVFALLTKSSTETLTKLNLFEGK